MLLDGGPTAIPQGELLSLKLMKNAHVQGKVGVIE